MVFQGEKLRELLRILRPMQALHYPKVRLGNSHDGGYVVLDDFAGIATLISCGIGDNVSFDRDVAARGVQVQQFDHSIARAPLVHPALHFHRRKIGAQCDGDMVNLQGIAAEFGLIDGLALLKIDIEGDEWGAFAAATPPSLRPYRQIVGEFHWLERASDSVWLTQAQEALARLCRDFAVVHVHGNNYSPTIDLDGVGVPSVLELTFAARRWYEFQPAAAAFPTALDGANDPARPDIALGQFVF